MVYTLLQSWKICLAATWRTAVSGSAALGGACCTGGTRGRFTNLGVACLRRAPQGRPKVSGATCSAVPRHPALELLLLLLLLLPEHGHGLRPKCTTGCENVSTQMW